MPIVFLDYGKNNPFRETVGKPRYLAWPVNVYRVTLPRMPEKDDVLNPFERVVLKLISVCGPMEARSLAQETRMPEDLVKGILLRLQDKLLLNEHNDLVKDPFACEAHESVQDYATALVFRELATGKLLPMLHLLDDSNPLRKKEQTENYFPKKVPKQNKYTDYTPQPRDIITLLKIIEKRSRVFLNDVRLPSIREIIISDDPESLFLECPIAIQKSDGEFRIACPFGNGFSIELEGAFSALLEENEGLVNWLMDWKDALSNPIEDVIKADKEPFDNDYNRKRYPKLVSCLRLRTDSRFRSIQQIFAAIEWALFYSCVQFPYDTVVKQLRIAKQIEHPGILKKAAEDLGLNPPEYGFRPVLEGKLLDFLSGKAELGTVLAISLLLAADVQSHPLRRIAIENGDFIDRLNALKDERNAQGHGGGRVRNEEIELPEETFMRKIVNSLLPSMTFSITTLSDTDLDTVADFVLDARTSIQNEFGFKTYNRLGSNLQERLIHSERFWLACTEGDNAQPFVCDLYAALQMTFRRKLSGQLPPEVEDREFIGLAREKAKETELGELPESMTSVKTYAIRQTLQGNDQTLGSCVIAFLLVADSDTLSFVSELCPNLLNYMGRIISLRGHGNQPIPIPNGRNDIRDLRHSAYTAVKTLMEV